MSSSSAFPPPPRSQMPSSFDDDPDFHAQNRWAKFKRLLLQDPLVPFGCALTVFALIGATRAMRSNDHARANKMFRRRIYAQTFTIFAIVLGSSYFSKGKEERKREIEAEKERVARERRERWLAELDFRDGEDRARKAEMVGRVEARRREGDGEGMLGERADGSGEGVSTAVRGLLWSKKGGKNEKEE